MRGDLAQNRVSRRQIGLFDPIQNAKPHPDGDCWTDVEGQWASLAQLVADPRTNGKPGIAWRWKEERGLHPRTPFADSKRPIPRPRNPHSRSGYPFGCKAFYKGSLCDNDRRLGHAYAWINPLTRKTCPNFSPFHPCQFQRRDLFSPLKIPLFISIRRDRTQGMNTQNLSSKLFVCLAVYFGDDGKPGSRRRARR